MMHKLKRSCIIVLTSFVTFYVGVMVVLSFLENSMVYFPAPWTTFDDLAPNDTLKDHFFTNADGNKLHALVHETENAKGHLLYLHGNAGHIGHRAEILRYLATAHQFTVMGVDYRGYGKSDGQPNEEGLYQDGEAALLELAKISNIKTEDIVILGRSLGGGVASHLAKHHQPKALVLESTFTTMPDVAQTIYPFLPVKLLMQNKYPSIDNIKAYRGPVLISHGDRDEIVPYALGQELFAAANEPKEFIPIRGGGHNDAYSADYARALQDFLRAL